jgi:hypothetical protein
MASTTHPHDTFWNERRQLAYVGIKVDPERLGSAPKPADPAIDRTVVRPGRGNRPLPEDDLVKRAREYRKTARSNRAAAARLAAEEVPFTPPVLKNLSPKYLRQYGVCPLSVEGGVFDQNEYADEPLAASA